MLTDKQKNPSVPIRRYPFHPFSNGTIGPILSVLGIGLIAEVIFLAFPRIDLEAARWFYLAPKTFLLSTDPIAHGFSKALQIGTRIAAAALLLLLPFRRFDRRKLIFLILSLALAPGLLVNVVFKDNWGRARPAQVAQFGGGGGFSRPWVVSDACPRNCAFVCGDCSIGFVLLAPALLVRRRRGLAVAAAVGCGAAVGAVRMAAGAHFLSDVVFSGVITSLTVLVLYRVLLMPPKKNPLKLNNLQLKTLALVQELANSPDFASPDPSSGEVRIEHLPHAHGDHFHIGRKVVASRDATGLQNEAVWAALDRKGLVRSKYPYSLTLTVLGKAYDTGIAEAILQGGDH